MSKAAPAEKVLPSQAERASAEQFQQLYSSWLTLRAAQASGIEDDGEWNARVDELEEAEQRLLFYPAPYKRHIFQKMEILELGLMAENLGRLADTERVLMAASAIKRDLIRFGFGE